MSTYSYYKKVDKTIFCDEVFHLVWDELEQLGFKFKDDFIIEREEINGLRKLYVSSHKVQEALIKIVKDKFGILDISYDWERHDGVHSSTDRQAEVDRLTSAGFLTNVLDISQIDIPDSDVNGEATFNSCFGDVHVADVSVSKMVYQVYLRRVKRSYGENPFCFRVQSQCGGSMYSNGIDSELYLDTIDLDLAESLNYSLIQSFNYVLEQRLEFERKFAENQRLA